MSRDPHIFLDMDGVLANFLKAACTIHNRPYEPESITQFSVAEVWGISVSDFWEPLRGQEFWENLEPYEWAKDFYEGLKEVAPVTILTAPSRDPGCIPGKIAWLSQNLGIKSYDVIPTGQKHFLARNRLCYLIDDSPEKCKKFEAYGGTPLVFYQPWNNWNGSGHSSNDWQTILGTATRLIRLEQHFSKAA